MHSLDLHVKPINQCRFGRDLVNGEKVALNYFSALLVFISYNSNMCLAAPSQAALHLNRRVIQQHFSERSINLFIQFWRPKQRDYLPWLENGQISHVSLERERRKSGELQDNHLAQNRKNVRKFAVETLFKILSLWI